jgi:hypothetical protein
MKKYRIFLFSLAITGIVIIAKYLMHTWGWELIRLGNLHTSVITGAFFVIGFLLSATIADYKESEKIPAEISSTIQNMYEDGAAIKRQYPKFDMPKFKKHLLAILTTFREDVRDKAHGTHHHVHKLNDSFISMEQAGVPANFIVKFKQQQAQLVRSLFRVNYIQRITFIPSATVLAQVIVALTISLLLLTEIEPFYGGMALAALISFILVYILRLLRVISTPFHSEGKTLDDVSLFLVDQARDHIKTER